MLGAVAEESDTFQSKRLTSIRENTNKSTLNTSSKSFNANDKNKEFSRSNKNSQNKRSQIIYQLKGQDQENTMNKPQENKQNTFKRAGISRNKSTYVLSQ